LLQHRQQHSTARTQLTTNQKPPVVCIFVVWMLINFIRELWNKLIIFFALLYVLLLFGLWPGEASRSHVARWTVRWPGNRLIANQETKLQD
jgi:hypothetical protein